jgi:arylsulfatase A-like enzyme
MKMGFDYERVADNGITYYNFKLKENNKVVYEAKDNEYLTDKLTDEAIGFIEKNKEKPFFLYLSHFAPHLLLQPKPQKIPMYFYMYNKLSKGKFDPYYGATIESLDDAVGVLLKKLDELKLLDNTLIVFTSDNGGLTAREFGTKPTDNSPLREGKGWLYEGGIRVPFIVYQKGVTDSMTVSNEPVTNLDFYPTFIEIASGKSPEKFDGKSINHLFDSKTKPSKIGEKPMFWHYPHFSNQGGRPSSIVRLGNLKLIYFYESKTYELYDLARDESETKNLIPEQPEVFEKLKSMLQNWLSSTSAVLPTPNLKK